MSDHRPLKPVKPAGMELVFLYPCPFCTRMVALPGPTQPSLAFCESCNNSFPIVPADDKSIQYVKIMLANGKAGIDPDFL